jgi:hypothetical protein
MFQSSFLNSMKVLVETILERIIVVKILQGGYNPTFKNDVMKYCNACDVFNV